MIARFFASLHGLLRRREIEGEISEELRDHLEREIDMHRSRGVPPEEARRLALRDLGGLTQTIESTRDVRATWLDPVWRDVRYAVRVFRRAPRFTLTALTLLVLGIGSSTAIFSIAYAVLVRPLPYPNADRLVFVAEKEGAGVIWPNFDDWRQRATLVRRLRQLARRRGHGHKRRDPATIRIPKRDVDLLSGARRAAVAWPALR